MSAARKVELVASVVGEHSLSSALAALELPKSTWYYHQRQKVDYEEKYARLRPVPEEIAREHPEYGYRRTTTELHETIRSRSTTGRAAAPPGLGSGSAENHTSTPAQRHPPNHRGCGRAD